MKQLEAFKKRLPPDIDIRIISNNTIKFRACFHHWEWIPENPVCEITKPFLSNARQCYLSREELVDLLEEVKTSRYPVLLLIVVLVLCINFSVKIFAVFGDHKI